MFTESFFLLKQISRDRLLELSFLDNIYSKPVLNPAPRDFDQILSNIQAMEKEITRKDTSETILQSHLYIVLDCIERSIRKEKPEPVSNRYLVLFKRFKEMVDKRFEEPWTASDYASSLHVSNHHLNRVVQHVCNQSATELIRNRKLLEAKRLLTFTDLTVSEITNRLGFTDSSYFAKAFKKESGAPPLDFRRQMSEKYRNL